MSRNDWLAILTVAGVLISIVGVVLTALGIVRGRRGDNAFFPDANPSRVSVLPQVAVTLVAAIVLSGGLLWGRGGLTCRTLTVASSEEKYPMLRELAVVYNDKGGYAGTGLNPTCVQVSVTKVRSGDAETALEKGWSNLPNRPDVWTPASSAWIKLLRAKAPGEKSLIPADYERLRLFSSPLVIAMPAPMAATLGPATIGWADIETLASDPSGWGSKGKPEWGPFRLGKTNPHISTSGLHALMATYDAIQAGTSPASVIAPKAEAFAGAIEASVIHYGSTATDFLRNLQDVDSHSADPAHLSVLRYVSAIAVEEKEVVDYNQGIIGSDARHPPPFVRLVPIYPKDGTPSADHPYVILGWQNTETAKINAATDFFQFLTAPAQRTVADQNGFRQVDGVAGRFLGQQPGVATRTPKSLTISGGDVLAAEVRAWDALRKPARVMILIDRASAPGNLDDALSHLRDAIAGFQGQDQVTVAVFPAAPESSGPYRVHLNSTAADAAQLPLLRQAVTVPALVSGTHTPANLDTALGAATTFMESTYADGWINAILVVDMSGDAEQPSDPPLESSLRAQPPASFVHVFAIGQAHDVRLPLITLAGGGTFYPPGSASHFIVDAISNF